MLFGIGVSVVGLVLRLVVLFVVLFALLLYWFYCVYLIVLL